MQTAEQVVPKRERAWSRDLQTEAELRYHLFSSLHGDLNESGVHLVDTASARGLP